MNQFDKEVLIKGKLKSVFSQTHKIDNIGIIANFVFPYVYM